MNKEFEEYSIDTVRKGSTRNILTHKPGCYIIEHLETGKKYVGSSVNLAGRVTGNLAHLKNGVHKNKNLQNLYNENPKLSVVFKETSTEQEARQLEQETVDSLISSGTLCNIAVKDVMRTRLGATISSTQREALSLVNKNRVVSDESKQKMRESQKAFNATPEGRAKAAKLMEAVSRKVNIEGKDYPSISEASRQLGIPYTTFVKKYKL